MNAFVYICSVGALCVATAWASLQSGSIELFKKHMTTGWIIIVAGILFAIATR